MLISNSTKFNFQFYETKLRWQSEDDGDLSREADN